MVCYGVAMPSPDEDLVRRCRTGEEAAFSELYGRYRGRVLSTATRIIKNPDDAQDATQEIFLKLYRSMAGWDPERARLSTWLYRMAANHAIDCWRVRRRRLRSETAGEAGERAVSRLHDINPRHAPHHALEEKELVTRIQSRLDSLPRLQRRFFVLRYFSGMALEEIAAMEHRSIGTVKGLLFRATRNMRRSCRQRPADRIARS